MRTGFQSLMHAVLLASACHAIVPAAAYVQAPAQADERRPLALAVRLGDPPSMDRELLREQLERELGVVVVLDGTISLAEGATLWIDAPTLQTVHVTFGESERTVDLSTAGAHAVETLALVTANLMRDEASDLLASLRATPPEPPAEPPAPAPPPPPVVAEKPAVEPERSGCDPIPERYKRVPFGVNLVPRVGTSSHYGADIVQRLAFNLIGGSAAALDGFELAGVFNHESYSVCGAQIAGGANIVNGPMKGFQLASLNMVVGRVDGGQVAFINTSSGTLHGFQAAFLNLALRGGSAVQVGFANVVTDDLVGSQIGFGNLAIGSVAGGQLGFGNVTLDGVRGVQIGFVNVAHRSLSGAQVGFVNTTAGESTGFQLGFVNVTSGQARGLMLGAVNVSENADAAVGLVNIYTKGRTQLDAWVTDAGLAMVGIEHGGRLLHNILGVGASTRSGQGVAAFAYGLGARVHESSSMYVDIDGVGYLLLSGEENQQTPDVGSILQLRAPIGFRLMPAFSLFVSPSLSVSVARNDADNALRDPSFYGARMTTAGSPVASSIWPGVSLGARFF
jgi:hypothetical protein